MDAAAVQSGSHGGVVAQADAPHEAALSDAASRSSTGLRLAGCGLAWLAGVAAQLQQATLWPLQAYAVAIASAMLLAALGLRARRVPWLRGALMACAAGALGLGISGWHAGRLLADALPPQLEGADVRLTGIVASLPQAGASGTRFRFEVESARWHGRPVPVPDLLAIGWYRGWSDEAPLGGPIDELRAGERWRFTVRLRQPHGNMNPHGFDYELWLFEQGVRATGYVRATKDDAAERLDAAAAHPVERARQHVRDAIGARLDDPRAAGVLAALAVGDQGAIERDDWDLYRNAGIAHLMSISGLHITMFAWLAGVIVAALWRRSARLMLVVPAPQAARWIGLAVALAYAVFSGWGVPSQRTLCMLATATLLLSLGRRWPWPLVLLAAAVAVTAFDPWALLQPGFWLSFVAVALLMGSEPAQRVSTSPGVPIDAPASPARRGLGAAGRVAHGALRTQVVATLGLTPLSLVFFQQVSLVGLVANLLAIPLVTLLITPLALLGVIAPPLWSIGGYVVQRLNEGVALLTALPGAVWSVPVAPAWAQLAALVAAALAVLPLPWRLRLAAVALALPLLWPVAHWPRDGAFELVAADIGQGTAVLVRTRGHLLLYDSGPQYSLESDAGQRVLLPLLRARGEQRIDRLMLSHRDSDHVGGAAALLRALPVAELWSSLEAGHPLFGAPHAGAAAPEAVRCEAGHSWSWDGVRFEVLHPPRADYERGLKPNALSCVLRVGGTTHSALLTGDIEHAQEAALLAAEAPALRSELLVVPHHGSKTSSTPDFLDAVQPREAVFQAGYRNRFGHPAAEVVARYRERGIVLHASPSCGAYLWPGDSAEAQGVCQRDVARRYWHHRAEPPDALPASRP
jgi:competence protein ComEC